MKTWNVMVDGVGYCVEYINNKQIAVNGALLNLKDYRVKTGFVQTDFEIPLGYKKALLVIRSMSEPYLVLDNRDCATGEQYVPAKMPIWAYIFMVLHCGNFMNGAIGGAMAAFGILITASVAGNPKMNMALRIVICFAVLAGAYAIVFGIALVLAGLLY